MARSWFKQILSSLLFFSVFLLLQTSCIKSPADRFWSDDTEHFQGKPFQDSSELKTLLTALEFQHDYWSNVTAKDPERTLLVGAHEVKVQELVAVFGDTIAFLEKKPTASEISAWLTDRYQWVRYVGDSYDRSVLVTSYFVPEYPASEVKTDRFRYPLYPPPTSSSSRRATRYEIDYKSALAGEVQPIAYLDNDVDRFFLHVQGSGVLIWPDGAKSTLGYGGNNGYDYVSLGKLLKQDGILDNQSMSLDAIKKYFTKNPDDFRRYAKKMPRYIYFKLKDHATGSLGLPVTPLRTIAVDKSRIPLGLLAYLQTHKPEFDKESERLVGWQDLRLLVLTQDTGGGIRGSHIDLFWGTGEQAGRHAGHMKQRGELHLLVPKAKPDNSATP